eukprot:5399959-Amphidinium_carterae.2
MRMTSSRGLSWTCLGGGGVRRRRVDGLERRTQASRTTSGSSSTCHLGPRLARGFVRGSPWWLTSVAPLGGAHSDGGAFMATADRERMPRRRHVGSRDPVSLCPTGQRASDQVLRARILASLRMRLGTQGFGHPDAIANFALMAPGEHCRGSCPSPR